MIPRPTDIPDQGLLCDLLWADPQEGPTHGYDAGWQESDRGVSFVFSDNIIN